MSLQDTYNRIAEDWFKEHHQDSWWVAGTEKFVSLLKTGASVLDVGCGAGVKSKWLLNKELRVTGVDFSEKMIEIAKREVPAGTFHVMDLKKISGLRATFDGIFAQAVLLHIPKAEAAAVIGDLKDRLKSGGYLYIAVKEKRPEGTEEEVLAENDYGYTYERFFSYYTLSEIKKYLADTGMEVVYENVVQAESVRWIQAIARK